MSGFLRKICIFFVFDACLGVSMAQRAVAISPVYTVSLWPNGGTANSDYLTKICRGTINGQMVFARPNSDNTCPTADASYSSSFSLSSSPINEFPQKYANHTDATDGYETFLGYQRWSYLNYIDSNGNLQSRTTGGSSGNGTLDAWWAGVTGVTPFVVNYYDGNNNTLVDTQSCTFGDPTGCDVLSPVYLGLTAPSGKYFDGWFCASGTGTNCRANRYLPSDYATLNTPITPYNNISISNWPNSSLWLEASRADLRDANGNVVTNMSYEYTGNSVNLYAAWAPYSVTFKCNPGAYTPFVGVDRVQSTYLDENGVQHGIVYGSVIPLDKNFGATSANPLCKSVYYEYDDANGNDQWCSEYLDDDAGISLGSVANYDNAFRGENPNISRSSDNKKIIYLIGSGATVGLSGSCAKAYVNYSCGSFGGTIVPGTPPNIRHNVGPSGLISTSYALTTLINSRQYPQPALPYKQTNGEYEACSTYTLTPTSGANAGIPQTFGTIGATTATDMGYGCCEKPQYAEFKGYEVRRANGELLNNGDLIQPGQYGAANCSVSFDNNTNPDTWQPGCDLWPWAGSVTLTAIWEHTPIMVTLNHNNADNAANLINSVWLKYGEGFYLYSINSGYSGEIRSLPVLPTRSGYIFGGYQYCDANDNCTMVVDSQGSFISGANNLKFTDVDITVSAVWGQTYTATYSCGTGTTGTAPTSDTVIYGTTPTLPSTAGSCAKAGYTLSGWRVDGESTDWVNGTSVWNFASDKNLTAQWTPNSYTMQYVCSDEDPGFNFTGAAPTATNPVSYNQNVTMAADPYSDQNGCRKIYGTQGNADYCDDCFTFGGWTIDAESAALEDPDLVHTANSTVSWGNTNGTNWCIVNTSGLCSGYSANDTFLVNANYTPKQYNITYMYATSPSSPNASMPANYTYSVGTSIANADQTAPAHATFNGWCTDLNDATTCVTAGQPITIGNRDHGDRTYYAKWSCNEGYSLSYNGNGDVVCNALVTCPAGQYLPANSTTCSDCIAGNYCPGGTFTLDENNAQGINICTGATYSAAAASSCTPCPTGYTYNTTSGKTDATQCQIHCDAGTWTGEYIQVEYIESTNTQYIDTGFRPNQDTSVVATYSVIDSSETTLFGARNGYNNASYGALYTGTRFSSDYGVRTEGCRLTSDYSNQKLIIRKNKNITELLTESGNVLCTINASSATFQTNYSMVFPGSRSGGTVTVGAATRRYYDFKIYDGNDLVRDFIPVRRISDNVVGMYDMVSDAFFMNAGSGTFTAGPDVGGMGCVNVGLGYYAAASTVNFGSGGTRTACPAGTYSNIPNAASCTQCSGATYNDTTGASSCTACPTGYDANTDSGKTDITQCQIHCDGGTYEPGYIQVEYLESSGTQYIDTGVVATLQTGVWLRAAITSRRNNTNNIIFGATDATAYANGNPFAIDFRTTSQIYLPHGGSGSSYSLNSMNFSNANNTVYDFKVNYMNDGKGYADTTQMNLGASTAMTTRSLRVFDLNTSTGGLSRFSPLGARVYDLILTEGSTISHHFVPVRRDSDNVLGMYDTVTGTFFTNSGTGTFIAGPDVGGVGCVNVGAGYWSVASTVNFGSAGTRNACSSGLTTIGYGAGADEASDCGRVLHVGENHVYLRGNRKTDRTLNVKIGNDTYYGNMCPVDINMSDGINHYLKIKLGNTVYSVYDDSAANNCVVPGA